MSAEIDDDVDFFLLWKNENLFLLPFYDEKGLFSVKKTTLFEQKDYEKYYTNNNLIIMCMPQMSTF